jgi:hypothetical protein
VVLGGFLTSDSSIYNPSFAPTITPVNESIMETWNAAVEHLRTEGELGPHELPSLFLPMTHQLAEEDRATGLFLAQHHLELAMRTPVLLAGHDHEACIEDAGQSLVVKVGSDAERIGFIDVWWKEVAEGDNDDEDKGSSSSTVSVQQVQTSEQQVQLNAMQSSVSMVPASLFPRDPHSAAFAASQAEFLQSMMSVPLARLDPTAMSSTKSSSNRLGQGRDKKNGGGGDTTNVRCAESSVASWLLSCIKQGLDNDYEDGGGSRSTSSSSSVRHKRPQLAMLQVTLPIPTLVEYAFFYEEIIDSLSMFLPYALL